MQQCVAVSCNPISSCADIRSNPFFLADFLRLTIQFSGLLPYPFKRTVYPAVINYKVAFFEIRESSLSKP